MVKNAPRIGLLLLALIAGLLVWHSISDRTSRSPIKITMHLWPGYVHSYIAQEKGFFQEEGVEVELNLLEGVDENLAHFREGKADAAFGLQSDAMLLAAQGVPLKIVYVADFSNGGDVVISGLDIRTVFDLKGKKISVDKLHGFNHIFLAELLRLTGLTEADVTIVPLPASEVPAALDAGTIDAGQTWEPYRSQAMANGYRLLASTRDVPGIVTDVLMFRSDVVDERPEDVSGVLRGLFRALRFRATNENEAYAIMAAAYDMPPGSLKAAIQDNVFPDLDANVQAFEGTAPDTSLLRTGSIISDFFLTHGVINEPVDLDMIHAPEITRGLQ